VKSIKLVIIFVIMILNGAGQDTRMGKIKELGITFGTFNTISKNNKVTVSPAISGYLDDYYFENRYNYETDNSASINVGKRIFKKSKHIEVVPMVGLVFGSFKGVTTELQTSFNYNKWTFSTDNQFSFEYRQPDKSLYFNWTMAIYKLTTSFHIGLTTFLDKPVNKDMVFDKGITAAILFKEWGLRLYAFNYEIEKRYYWISIRYNIKVKLISK
jgi:hypothetical protein